MPKRKKSTNNINEPKVDQSFKMKKITPLNDAQDDVFTAFYEGFNLFLYGVAGSGKTLISLAMGLKEVLNPNTPYQKVYIVRSTVPSRDMGFLPGKASEKMAVYEAPYIKLLNNDLFGRGDAYQIAVQKQLIEIVPTSFLRGTEFENCIVIADETQNMNYEELKTIVTRCAKNCRIIFCGDHVGQNDLYRNKWDVSGLPKFQKVIELMESFEMIEFFAEDIVRGGICKEFILAEMKSNGESNSVYASSGDI